MSFSAYPQYRDSGIETLGEIPSHWDVTRLPYVIFENNAGEVIDKNFWGDGSELLYTCAKQPLLSDYKDFPDRKRTGANDLLLTRNGTPYVHLPSQGAIYSNVVQRVSLIPGMDRKFMRSALDVATRDLVGYGVSIASFNYEMWAALRIPLPDYDEQTQIARFLDHETARIDALIEEQQRLIELLKEKRQAVISHAVTKGLDPTVPMKDSGVEWLGEVPAHWELSSVKYVVTGMGQGWSPQCDNYPAQDGEWGVLKVGCVNGGNFNPAENKRLPDDLEPDAGLAIQKGDLLISRANTRELVGSAAVALSDYPRLMLCDKLYRLRLSDDKVAPEFLALYLGSSAARSQIELAASGASDSMQNISQAVIMDMHLPLPPVGEQKSILRLLDDILKCSDELVVEVTTQRHLLQERRSALISAAVTGKIDVRGWQPPASSQAPEPAVAEAV